MPSNRFHFIIDNPDKNYFSGEIESLSIVTTQGTLTILAHHTDLIANVEISHMVVHQNGHVLNYAIAGGVLNVYQKENTVVLCVNAIESQEEINLDRALKAKQKAENILKEENLSIRDGLKAEIKLKRALNRISLKKTNNL